MSTRLAIDSGPLIATLFAKDRYHHSAVAGFEQLQQERWELFVPVPIVFEVYRWLLQQRGPKLAQAVFAALERSFSLYVLSERDFWALREIVLNLGDWQGTLADAAVAYLAMHWDCPVWTLDYRDLSVFPTLKFWQPERS